ncbi:MAG: CcoQ/FixQ family Cbb3-type cytochrome c oxidase assembly chaperone [Bacteroidia bacterium]|jgi:cytochrome c oxidase cbb3-type subunit 3
MKFKNYLETISGIEIYPMISLLIFVLFFIVLIVWVIKLEKSEIIELENLPFSENKVNNTQKSSL